MTHPDVVSIPSCWTTEKHAKSKGEVTITVSDNVNSDINHKSVTYVDLEDD